MKINNLGKNRIEIQTEDKTILVSYNTPVAANINGKFYRTSKHWSTTTSRHINQWLHGAKAEEKDQEFFDKLLN